MAGESLKVGVWRGDGPPPGYRYTVLIPSVAFEEAMSFLTPDQYEHAKCLMKDLATHDDPTHSVTQRVEAIGGYYELKDKGGVLGKVNLRIFFHVGKSPPVIVILGVINKKNEGQPSNAVKMRIRRRQRKYLNGEWRLAA